MQIPTPPYEHTIANHIRGHLPLKEYPMLENEQYAKHYLKLNTSDVSID
jgi:hypothetical protein